MSTHQRPAELRTAIEGALGVGLTSEEVAILAGRLRFDDTPALSQQAIADRLGYSQPHLSNLERELIKKLNRATERRRDERSRAKEIHQVYEAMMKAAEALGEKLPPRSIRLRARRAPVA
jgi:ParB-like chromosome segregation protein Spo0J